MKKLLVPFLLLPLTSMAQVEFSANYGLNTALGYETKATASYTLLNTIKAGIGYEYANFKTDINDLADPAQFPFVFIDYVKKFKRSDIYTGISYSAYHNNGYLPPLMIPEGIHSTYRIQVMPITLGYSYRFYKAFSVTAEASYNLVFYTHAFTGDFNPNTSYTHYQENNVSLAAGIKYTLGKSWSKAKPVQQNDNKVQ
jgi:hypothetical protein